MTEQELREPPLLSDEQIKEVLRARKDEIFSKPDAWASDRFIAQAQRFEDIKWMKEHCYLKAKRNLPKCKPVSICPQNAYKEAQLDMLKEVDGVSFKACKEFKD